MSCPPWMWQERHWKKWKGHHETVTNRAIKFYGLSSAFQTPINNQIQHGARVSEICPYFRIYKLVISHCDAQMDTLFFQTCLWVWRENEHLNITRKGQITNQSHKFRLKANKMHKWYWGTKNKLFKMYIYIYIFNTFLSLFD